METYNLFLYNTRMSLKMKRHAFAKRLHINYFVYRLLEKGYFKPTKKIAEKISKALNIDFSLYLEGERYYPVPLPEDKQYAIVGWMYQLFKNKIFRIISIFVFLLSFASLITSFVVEETYQPDYNVVYSERYMEFDSLLKEKGLPVISITNSVTRPSIQRNADDCFYIIKGEYNTPQATAQMTVHKEDYRLHYLMSTTKNIIAVEVTLDYYSDQASVTMTYTEPNKDVYMRALDNTAASEDELKLMEEYLPYLNDNFDLMINDSLGIDYAFYEELLPTQANGSAWMSAVSMGMLLWMSLSIAITFLLALLLAFALIYGKRKDEVAFYHVDFRPESLGTGKKAKRDFHFGPFIPETICQILAIIFVFACSLRVIYYVGAFFGYVSIGGNDFTDIPSLLVTLFNIGMFLHFIVMFDIYLDDRRLFFSIIMDLLLYFSLYFLTLWVTNLLETSSVLALNSLAAFTIPNNFGSMTCYFLMMLTLFYTPKKIKTHKGLVIYRWLTVIPITINITFTVISKLANTTWGWNLPSWALYIFSSQAIQLSSITILFLLSLFALKTFYERKYGKEKAAILECGNRFTWLKNIILALIILFVTGFEFLFKNNVVARNLGIGTQMNLGYLALVLLFYRPHLGKRNVVFDKTMLVLYYLSFSFGYILIVLTVILILIVSLINMFA